MSDFDLPILRIFVVNQQGHNLYEVGEKLNGKVINRICHTSIYYSGDPFSRYCGFDADGKLLFSLEPNMPLNIKYETK